MHNQHYEMKIEYLKFECILWMKISIRLAILAYMTLYIISVNFKQKYLKLIYILRYSLAINVIEVIMSGFCRLDVLTKHILSNEILQTAGFKKTNF